MFLLGQMAIVPQLLNKKYLREVNTIDTLVHPKEKVYYIICLVISMLIYLVLAISVVGILYVLMVALIILFAHGLLIAGFRGNGIKVSERQFPEIFRLACDLTVKMELDSVPDIYVIQSGGLINAFATRFMGRKFVILYSEIVEIAYEEGADALAFVIAHELAHLKRKHVQRQWLLYPALIIPFLGTAYSRACEYTCDSFGNYYHPGGAISGLLVLAAGNKLYQRVSVKELCSQAHEEGGFFLWFFECLSTHPILSKRVAALSAGQAKTIGENIFLQG